MRDLSLSELEHKVAKMLKAKYGISWPFAAHIAKDTVCFIELENLKAERDTKWERLPNGDYKFHPAN